MWLTITSFDLLWTLSRKCVVHLIRRRPLFRMKLRLGLRGRQFFRLAFRQSFRLGLQGRQVFRLAFRRRQVVALLLLGFRPPLVTLLRNRSMRC